MKPSVSSRYMAAIYRALSYEIGDASARYAVKKMEPVFDHMSRNDFIIKTNRAALKAMKAHKRMVKKRRKQAEKQQRAYNLNINGIRADKSRVGYANGVEFTPKYSAYPYWHRPGAGRTRQPEN